MTKSRYETMLAVYSPRENWETTIFSREKVENNTVNDLKESVPKCASKYDRDVGVVEVCVEIESFKLEAQQQNRP